MSALPDLHMIDPREPECRHEIECVQLRHQVADLEAQRDDLLAACTSEGGSSFVYRDGPELLEAAARALDGLPGSALPRYLREKARLERAALARARGATPLLSPTAIVAQVCLSCGKTFVSTWGGDRYCPKCVDMEDSDNR